MHETKFDGVYHGFVRIYNYKQECCEQVQRTDKLMEISLVPKTSTIAMLKAVLYNIDSLMCHLYYLCSSPGKSQQMCEVFDCIA